MAGNYYVATQRRDIEVFAPNAPIDVERVGFVTQPSQIYAEVAVPLFDWQADEAASLIGPMAEGIEAEMTRPEVAGMVYEQDTNASGQLVDNMVVTVQYNPPPGALVGSMTAEVRVPTYGFAGQGRSYLVDTPIAAALAALTATANL